MVGFVFGMAGVRAGRIIHWSDMLAVREDARDRGIGQQLKAYQRDAARATGRDDDVLDVRSARRAQRAPELQPARRHRRRVRRGHVRRIDERPASRAWHRPLRRCLAARRESLGSRSAEDRCRRMPAMLPQPRCPAMTGEQLAALDATAAGACASRSRSTSSRCATRRRRRRLRWRSSTRQAFQWALGSGFAVTRFATGRYARTRLLCHDARGRRGETVTLQLEIDRAAGDPAPAQGAVPDLLGRLHRAANHAARADRRERRGRMVGVRRRRRAELQRGDDRHRVARDSRVARPTRAWPAPRRIRHGQRCSRARHRRAQHGEGGDRDGVLGARRERRGSRSPAPRRDARPRADRHLDRHPGQPGGAGRARASRRRATGTGRSR